jgi:hypothetical protein
VEIRHSVSIVGSDSSQAACRKRLVARNSPQVACRKRLFLLAEQLYQNLIKMTRVGMRINGRVLMGKGQKVHEFGYLLSLATKRSCFATYKRALRCRNGNGGFT